MSWNQVYVTGLSQTASEDPSDEELEQLLVERYHLSNDDDVNWAGVGTTLVKRDKETGGCRGYAFLAFWTLSGATIAVERINNYINNNHNNSDNDTDLIMSSSLPLQLRAELSQPKKTTKKKGGADSNNSSTDVIQLRLRRKRTATARKHPVITSSDKSKTGLGNKTK
jgi:RNA recognition motif-containing protein